MRIIMRLKTIIVACAALSAIFLASTFFLIALNSSAQIDIDACQKEYNARRSQCIVDNKTCTDACYGNQNCELTCNNQRNACDDAAVARQKECLGLNASDQDLPMVDVSPVPLESPPQTTIPRQAQPQTSPETPPLATPQPTTAESPEQPPISPAQPTDEHPATKPPKQPVEQSTEHSPQIIVDLTNNVDNLFITLPGGFDSIFVTFLDKITENNPEIFLNKQPDEQQKMIDDFTKSEKPATVVIGTVDGKPIEVELRDMPLADTAKEPLEAVARQDTKGILEISPSLWLNSEETLIRGAGPYPIPGGEQEKYLLSEEHRQKGHFSLPIVDPIGLSFDEYHQKKGEMLEF